MSTVSGRQPLARIEDAWCLYPRYEESLAAGTPAVLAVHAEVTGPVNHWGMDVSIDGARFAQSRLSCMNS